MAKLRVNPYVVSATLFTMLVATFTIGVLGMLMNTVVEPQSLFERMLSNNASLLGIAISCAIAGLLFQRPVFQRAGSLAILLLALHSLLVGTNLANIFFMSWLNNIEATFPPGTIVVFVVLSVMLALNPAHPIQRLWMRVTSALIIVFSSIMLMLHITPDGFMLLGPHPDITSLASVLFLIIGLAYQLLSLQQNIRPTLPSKPAIIVGALCIVLTGSLWYFMGYHSLKNIQTQAEREIERLASARATMAMVNVQLMERMTERWEVAATNQQNFDKKADVRAYLRDIPHLLSITALNGTLTSMWHELSEKNTGTGHEILADAQVQRWLMEEHSDTSFLIPEVPYIRSDATPLAVMLIPIDEVVSDVRFVLAVFDLNRMMNPATRLTNDHIKIYTQLSETAERSFDSNKPSHNNELGLASTTLTMSHGPELTLHATLYDFSELSSAANMRTAIVALGILFSLAFVLMIEQNAALRRHSLRLARTQRQLRQQQHELSLNEQRYKSLFSHHPDPVFSLDCEGRFSHVNDAFCEQVEVTREQALKMHFGVFLNEQELARVGEIFNQVTSDGESQRYEADITTYTTKTTKIFDITNLPIIIDGQILGTFGIAKDVTHLKQQAELLAYQAGHDGLTGLLNRAALEHQLHGLIQHQQLTQQAGVMALLFIDLDGFKPVNDNLGLEVGDDILRQAAARLESLSQQYDLVARFGGDEFVFVRPDFASQQHVEDFVKQTMQLIDEPYQVGALGSQQKIYLTASIGVTMYTPQAKQAVTLIQQADVAMSRAKQQGRNHYQFYSSQRKSMSQSDIILRSQFQHAIDTESLQLYYQPIIDLNTGKIASVEALMRWTREDGTSISPGEFIPLAEATGQIIPAGAWSLRQACTDIHILQQHGVSRVAVNLSALQFHRANFFEQIQQILADTNTPTEMLELELTESILMENTSNAIQVLERLRDLGIAVAIDDFGTGFSGLSYLKTLPVSKLKVDRAFIKELSESSGDRVITEGIINMAHQVGLEVVAEGVETGEQAQLLKQYGCGFAQGFYYLRPMPLTDLLMFLKTTDLV